MSLRKHTNKCSKMPQTCHKKTPTPCEARRRVRTKNFQAHFRRHQATPGNRRPQEATSNTCKSARLSSQRSHFKPLLAIGGHFKPFLVTGSHFGNFWPQEATRPLQATFGHRKPLQATFGHRRPLQATFGHRRQLLATGDSNCWQLLASGGHFC